jgi:hypothetical protein
MSRLEGTSPEGEGDVITNDYLEEGRQTQLRFIDFV